MTYRQQQAPDRSLTQATDNIQLAQTYQFGGDDGASQVPTEATDSPNRTLRFRSQLSPSRKMSTMSARTGRSLARSQRGFNSQERRELQNLFRCFDTDKKGYIDFIEFKVLVKKLGIEMTDEQLLETVARIDPRPDPQLDFDSFIGWLEGSGRGADDELDRTMDPSAMLKARIKAQGLKPLDNQQIEGLRECFAHFDGDGSGTIDITELGEVFREFGQEVSEHELHRIMDELDADGSGEIEFDEFLMLMIHNFAGEESMETEIQTALREHSEASGDGLITRDELKRTIRELCGVNDGKHFITESEIEAVVESAVADVNATREQNLNATRREVPAGCIEYMKWDCLWKALED